MSGGIGACQNPTCRQIATLLEGGFCSDDCRCPDCRSAAQPTASTGIRP
jgi:hypothetical protein